MVCGLCLAVVLAKCRRTLSDAPKTEPLEIRWMTKAPSRPSHQFFFALHLFACAYHGTHHPERMQRKQGSIHPSLLLPSLVQPISQHPPTIFYIYTISIFFLFLFLLYIISIFTHFILIHPLPPIYSLNKDSTSLHIVGTVPFCAPRSSYKYPPHFGHWVPS